MHQSILLTLDLLYSNKKAWCASIDVDVSGNFLYCGGGQESSTGVGSHGWAAVSHLSGMSSQIGIQPIHVAKLPTAVQELCVFGDDIVCGGAQPQIRYMSSVTLGNFNYIVTCVHDIV